MQSDWLVAILLIYCLFNLIYISVCLLNEEFGLFKVLPWDLRKSTEMNIFGCIFVSLLALIFLPLVYIGRLIFWLCTVKIKRKD